MKDRDFIDWNEMMFKRYRNERLYNHPNPIIRYTENKRVKLIINMLFIKENDRVLDIGCGEGYIIGKMDKGEITGIDLSKTALSMAREKLVNKSNINLLRGNAEKMSFHNDTFNKIFCTELLEHVPCPEKVIKEIIRVSKIDSDIVITVPNEDLINSVKRFLLRIKLFDLLLDNVPREMNKEWHLHMFNLNRLKGLIRDELEIISIRATPFLIFPIRYVVRCRRKK